MDWQMFLGSLACFLIVIALLWLANTSRHHRFRQRWCPLVALILASLAVWVYVHPYVFIEQCLVNVAYWLNVQLGSQISTAPDRFPLLYNLALFVSFLLIKSGWRISTAIVGFFRAIYRWVVSKLGRKKTAEPVIEGVFPAYTRDMSSGAVLCDSWVYPGQYFRILGVVAFLILLCALACDFAPATFVLPLTLPMLPAVPLLLILEISWYLGGLRQGEERGETAGFDVAAIQQGSFDLLWKKYHSLWPERLLVADPALKNPSDGMDRSLPRQGSGAIDNNIEADCELVEQCLGKQRILLNVAQKNILRDIWQGRDLIIIEPVYQQLAPVLFASLQHKLLNGNNILFVIPERLRRAVNGSEEIEKWVRRWLDFPAYAAALSFDVGIGVSSDKRICIASVNEILQQGFRDHVKWFRQLSTVVFVDTMEVISRDIGACQALCLSLSDLCVHSPQLVLLTREDRMNLEPAMRNSLGVQPIEYALQHPFPARSYILAWGNEGESPYQENILNSSRYLGSEPVFAVPALRDGIGSILLTGMQQTTWQEAFEEIDKNLISVEAKRLISKFDCTSLLDPLDMPVVITNDQSCCLPIAFKNSLSLGKKEVLVLVGAPAYLFRNYFADNIQFFLTTDSILRYRLAVSPLFDRYGIACCLISRLLVSFVRDNRISELLDKAGYSQPVLQGLTAIVEDCFGINLLRDGLLEKETRFHFDPEQNKFVEAFFIKFNEAVSDKIGNAMSDCYQVVDKSDNIKDVVPGEHVYQLFLPGQVHVFDGEPYKIEEFFSTSKKIRVTHTHDNSFCHYRPKFGVRLGQMIDHSFSKQRTEVEEWFLSVAVCEADFTVKTDGYYTLYQNGSTYGYEKLAGINKIPERYYACGRMLKFCAKQKNSSSKPFPSDTFALLLQESFKTIFPEKWQFLLVSCLSSVDNNSGKRLSRPFDLLSQLDFSVENDVSGELVLFFFEDSHRDLGLIKALYDNWQMIFDLLADYLSWLLYKEELSDSSDINLVYGTGINFCRNELDECLQLLNELTKHLPHQLQAQRRKFLESNIGTEAASEGRVCDFCGEMMSGSSFESLDDGRDRCPDCRDTAVDTVDELNKVYKDARKWLVKRFYPLQLRKSIQIRFTTAEEIAREHGRPFVATAGFDARAVGFARLASNEYSIYIENGQPYHMTLATMTHELTHIWQYDNLDMRRLEEENGLLYIEGHATWVEICCLQGRGIGLEFCEHELQRQDVYGQGARAIKEIVASGQNPFVFLAQGFSK